MSQPTGQKAAAAPQINANGEVQLDGYDPEQVRLMEEMCILVDGDDKVVGFDTKKNTHIMANIEKGLLHRAFSVFLFNHENKLLLQQRADEKITFPGYWTNTCCSHPLAKKDELNGVPGAKTAAVRKLDHELGITGVAASELQFLTRIHYLAPSDATWGEHEVDYIFIAKKDKNVALRPSPNEVKATRYVTPDELRALFVEAEKRPNEVKLTPWFRLICENFLFDWWKHLEAGTLAKCAEVDKIHKMV
ncbi:isopentenyl-diphosphate delta-isomerase [Allomyces macrogynus ATCC 38327]|uniref:isopentenyl-diphosphate Delta-isomerase n=1 Tax=Allomyces macrogynus (strain ATCC 38327) TaxID=578462 RepID=A0A0L0SNC2_ALLM3|nr:isopentenyl-diphosphate delta-isomerase [Allomyces macrogynus ATCC 38327]|eukprot:KNE63992.1 isopentenyl-diphosphate delta-isomerase [Allomyces macrogynus ATCC 38327]